MKSDCVVLVHSAHDKSAIHCSPVPTVIAGPNMYITIETVVQQLCKKRGMLSSGLHEPSDNQYLQLTKCLHGGVRDTAR